MTNEQPKRSYYIRNRWMTPDGTILESKHVHDYQGHTDAITGEYYMTDGLWYYIRTTINETPARNLCVTSESPWEEQRSNFSWKSYGKNLEYPEGKNIFLKDMTDEHIDAVIRTQRHIQGTPVEELFLKEQEYRKANGIEIKE